MKKNINLLKLAKCYQMQENLSNPIKCYNIFKILYNNMKSLEPLQMLPNFENQTTRCKILKSFRYFKIIEIQTNDVKSLHHFKN